MLHVSTLPPKGGVYPSLYPSPWTQTGGVRMRRARRFRDTGLKSNVVVSVACVPFVSMRMLFNFGEFLIDFGTISGPFFYLQTMFKQCLFTLYVAYTQSVISNTPYKVLKVFHLRGSVEIQLKSVTLRA